MDPEFEAEQRHLDDTYAKLLDIERQCIEQLRLTLMQASQDKSSMSDELALDFTSDDMSMETYADLEAMNRIIDGYSLSSEVNTEQLAKARLLLQQPYFAKVSLQFKPGEPARDIYLGAAGMVDESYRHFIVDWRSPVAETYYNQENGKTSYEAHGRTISCELKLRRQFDIFKDELRNYFDTTIAIQDPLLLASLTRNRTSQLKAITATIQREQNLVIRHDDVPVLLVSGIAGSGKTSVLLQRIAYLFYRERENLKPDQVFLLSPNPVFGSYIADVLPDMGESNPQTITWRELISQLGMGSRASCDTAGWSAFESIDEAVFGLRLEQADLCDLRVGDERVITSNQVRNAIEKHAKVPVGPRLAALVNEELHERLEQRIKRLSKSEDVHDEVSELDLDEQIRIFGRFAQTESEEEAVHLAALYLRDRYRLVEEAIEGFDWLRIDRIGMRMLKSENLSAEEWLYLKMAITGYGNRDARYVMIDEVQDYTLPQLAVLIRYFKNARFLLLGDENQAIRNATATFDQIRMLFACHLGQVHECELMTSYRSSPEITELFCSLLPQTQRVKTSSVQEPGIEPVVRECLTDGEYLEQLRCAVRTCRDGEGLSAVIVDGKSRASWIAKQFADEEVEVVDSHRQIHEGGVCVIPLDLAKGLEFDRVVVPDAQASVYGQDDVSRHRLYTAMSRATKQLTILSQGPMTPLLPKT